MPFDVCTFLHPTRRVSVHGGSGVYVAEGFADDTGCAEDDGGGATVDEGAALGAAVGVDDGVGGGVGDVVGAADGLCSK